MSRSRQTDRKHLAEVSNAVQETARGVAPEISIEQLAGMLTSGVDDPHPVGKASLYKVCEGRRALPAHKIAALVLATGNAEVLRVIARECGYLLVAMPKVEDLTLHALRDVVRTEAAAVEAVCRAMDHAGPSCEGITLRELHGIESKCDAAAAACVALKCECQEHARRARGGHGGGGVI